MSQLNWYRSPHAQRLLVSGGRLNVPRTPVQRIVLYAKLKRLKADAEQRRQARA